jgi:hypothetical protein
VSQEHSRSFNIIKTSRVATSWDKDLKETALPMLKAHLEEIYGKRLENKEIFLLCLSVGFEEKHLGKIPPRKSDAVRLNYFDEKEVALMRSVALAHANDFQILIDEDAMYDVIEQYAAGGLELLYVEIQNQPNFQAWLISQMTHRVSELRKENQGIKPEVN